MKALTLISSLIATAYAAPSEQTYEYQAAEWKADAVAAPTAENPLTRSTVNGEKVLPRLQDTKVTAGLKRTTVKYGSWSVTSAKMLSTFKLAQGPCPGVGCYVTAMEATIRYPDGKEANVDTGAWLHHIALFGSGTSGGGIWAAGNERPTLRLNSGGKKFGIDFPSSFMMMIDLMTEDIKPKNLTLEILYETAPKTGLDYRGVVMHWLTIGEPMAKAGKYSFNTLPSLVSVGSGKLLYAIGHMHDGGTDMQLFINSKMVCKSVMHYNAREGYGSATKSSSKSDSSEKMSSSSSSSSSSAGSGGLLASLFGGSSSGKSASSNSKDSGHSHKMLKIKRQHAHGGGNDGAMHISDPGACTDFGEVKKNDRLTATANYDANKFKLMVHNGAKEKLMGNMRVYIGDDKK